MIILDTNVLSAVMQRVPDQTIIAWLDHQTPESLWVSSITVFEVHHGIELLESGRRKNNLLKQFHQLIQEDLQYRVLPFDTKAAEIASQIAAERKKCGLIVDMRDTFIAGVVLANKAKLATRNTKHFADLGKNIINPWVN